MKTIWSNRLRACVSLFLLFKITLLSAHDMYLWPVFRDRDSDRVSLALFVEKQQQAWMPSMLVNLRLSGPAEQAKIDLQKESDPIVQFNHVGTYVIGWESERSLIQIDPVTFNKYLHLEGYADVISARRKLNLEQQPGREIYRRYLKTLIQFGDVLTDQYRRPFGYRIEIIPMANPGSLHVDSNLDVMVLFDKQPLKRRRIMATYDSHSNLPEDYAQITETDENGIARFRITHKGLWMIRTNEILPLQHPEADWESFWANFTFVVN